MNRKHVKAAGCQASLHCSWNSYWFIYFIGNKLCMITAVTQMMMQTALDRLICSIDCVPICKTHFYCFSHLTVFHPVKIWHLYYITFEMFIPFV